MARLTARQKNTIVRVIKRWADTYAGTRPVNYDRIRELINIAYAHKTAQKRKKTKRGYSWKTLKLNNPTIHFLKSPLAFNIAQAVLRGRLSKTAAVALCKNYGIDAEFVGALRRDVLTNSFGNHNWYRGYSPVGDIWHETLEPYATAAKQIVFADPEDARPARRRRQEDKTEQRYRRGFEKSLADAAAANRRESLRNIENNYFRTLVQCNYVMVGVQQLRTIGNFSCNNAAHPDVATLCDTPWSNGANRAMLDRCALAAPDSYSNSYIDAEIVANLLDTKKDSDQWAYELMHETHVVMMFERQTLVLSERPELHLNAAGELHNDEGPALRWADGAKQYYIDGHALGHLGEKIVERPQDLTITNINEEQNEEIKRVAIDKYGWGRYLDDVGAAVLERRENAVDNTIEALVSVRTKSMRRSMGWRAESQEIQIEQRKLILSCRSTARQYFLAVPETTSTCEEGQRWMAEGANTPFVAALNHPVRVIGAS